MEKGAGLFIVYGVYHWKTKRVAFRDDYCLVCGEARRAVQVRTFDVGHIFGIPILPAGFWKRWVCTVCGRDPHVTTKTRRGFKWAELFILVLFAAVSWIVPDDPDAVPVFWGLRIAAPVGAILTLMHLLRTKKEATLKEKLATIPPADTVCPFCGAQLLTLGSQWSCQLCGVVRSEVERN